MAEPENPEVLSFRTLAAPGTIVGIEMLQTAPYVELRLIKFEHPGNPRRPRILFIAGWVSLIEGWGEVLREMTRDFSVYYLETREKISSRVGAKVSFSVDAIGRDIVRAIDMLGFEDTSYIFFGSSLGATAILDSTRHLTRRPRCLILVSPNAEFRVPRIWKIIVGAFYPPLYALIKPSVKWYLRTFRLDLESDHEQYEKYCRALDAADPAKLKPGVLSLARYTVWPLLNDIPYSSLIIGASKDKLHEPYKLKKIVEILPAAVYVDLETNKRTHSREMVEHIRTYLRDHCK